MNNNHNSNMFFEKGLNVVVSTATNTISRIANKAGGIDDGDIITPVNSLSHVSMLKKSALQKVTSVLKDAIPCVMSIMKTTDKNINQLHHCEMGELQAIALLGKVFEVSTEDKETKTKTFFAPYWGDNLNPRVAVWVTSLLSHLVAKKIKEGANIRVIAYTHNGLVLNGIAIRGINGDGDIIPPNARDSVDFLWTLDESGEFREFLRPVASKGCVVQEVGGTMDELFYEGWLGVAENIVAPLENSPWE